MNDYLAKPVDLGRLAEVLDRWLRVAASETDEVDLTSLARKIRTGS